MAIPFLIVRVDQFPTLPVANAMYIVKDATRPERANIVFTGKNAQDKASLVTFDDIDTIVVDKITNALRTNQNIRVFATYVDMMESIPEYNTFAYVKDNTDGQGDPLNPASYIYDIDLSEWTVISTGTFNVQWNNIIGRPIATPSQIDQSVMMSHEHDNMAVLDKISSTAEGELTFGNKLVSNVVLTTTDW